jgi:hypothetical protein
VVQLRHTGTALVAWQGAVPVAQLTWEVVPGGWYVNFLASEQPAVLPVLLAGFRRLWRASGCPLLTFETFDADSPVKRLAQLLSAQKHDSFYSVTSLQRGLPTT